MTHATRVVPAVLICCGLLVGPASAEQSSNEQEAPTFEKHVRPILKAACFQCHGEEAELKGEFDVRLRRLIVAGGESGAAVQPGDRQQSLLYQRIEAGEMPPGEARLTAQQIETIGRWIDGGARTTRVEPDDPDELYFTDEELTFWSFRPVVRPDVPQVKEAQSVRNPIDAFLLARLEQENLSFSAEADKETLIRRAFFDLVGLPPSLQQIDRFLADKSPGAYERLIDRLLASPHYGERWGRHWLDVAGYADSEGYTDDDRQRDSAFRYRDYVIRSLNDDKPLDRFITEQLAGDEMVEMPYKNLSPDEVDKLVATGFLRMAPDGTGSGAVDQNIARNQVVAETINIVSTSLLGLTVGCAQCHDHRYDPIPQADYYRLRAVFEPALDWKKWRAPPARRISLYSDDDHRRAAQIEAEAKKIDRVHDQRAQEFIDQTLDWQLLTLPQNVRQPLRVAYKTPVEERTAQQKQLLDEYPKILKISVGSLYLYDREIRGNAAKIDNQRRSKEVQFVQRAQQAEIAKLSTELQAPARAALKLPAAKRTAAQQKLLADHPGLLVTAKTLAEFDPPAARELARLKKTAADLRATQKADRLEALRDQAVAIRAKKPTQGFIRPLTEVPGQVPATFLFDRGNFDQPKEQLSPAGLSVLASLKLGDVPPNDSSLPTTGRRLALARRLTGGAHPLVARVLVNRVWLHHFGRGIVETPGDFGALGARPTHPRLLDYLADELVAGGWKLKRLHKLMMTSTAYRQTSGRSGRLAAVDGDNRLYGRMSLRRLEAEMIRDSILAISGKLNDKMYGAPVPVMEDDVGQVIIGRENLDGERKPGAAIDLKGEEFRRSTYVQVRRSRPLAVLDTFDAPAMEPNCTQRSSSTVAPQALMLMNSQFAARYAALIAQRVQHAAGDDPHQQVRHAWRLAFGRTADEAPLDASVEFLARQTAHYQQHPTPDDKTPPPMRALASFCQALISSNGFLYVD